jgi:hypothetical protein
VVNSYDIEDSILLSSLKRLGIIRNLSHKEKTFSKEILKSLLNETQEVQIEPRIIVKEEEIL